MATSEPTASKVNPHSPTCPLRGVHSRGCEIPIGVDTAPDGHGHSAALGLRLSVSRSEAVSRRGAISVSERGRITCVLSATDGRTQGEWLHVPRNIHN